MCGNPGYPIDRPTVEWAARAGEKVVTTVASYVEPFHLNPVMRTAGEPINMQGAPLTPQKPAFPNSVSSERIVPVGEPPEPVSTSSVPVERRCKRSRQLEA